MEGARDVSGCVVRAEEVGASICASGVAEGSEGKAGANGCVESVEAMFVCP